MSPKVPVNEGSRWLIAGGWLSILASLLHVACMVGGPDWFRFFGAGEPMAQAVEQGKLYPYVMTSGIGLILAIWAAYAFSGAGRMMRLPLLRTALVIISAIYLGRALIVIPLGIVNPKLLADPFALWSSLIVLIYGLAYAVGTAMAWKGLEPSWPTH